MAVIIFTGVRCEHPEHLDESQLEVSKELVKWRVFKDEASAKKAKVELEKSTGLVWSDVGHIGDKWYTGYCEAGALAVEAVRLAGEYYKLNVPLTAGYMLGNSWGTCH